MSVKNLLKLPKKTVDHGERLLADVISAPEWLAMLSSSDEQRRQLGEDWHRIFCSPPPKPIEFPDSESQARCRELFGPDFFGMEEAAGPYGYVFSEPQIEERKPVRILARDGSLLSEKESWKLIRLCHERAPGQFVCCVGVPHSTCGVFERHPENFPPLLREHAWFAEVDQRRAWSGKQIADFWFLLRKEPVPDSWDLSSTDQERWLPQAHPHERFAQPEHIVYGNVLCERVTQGSRRLLHCDERWIRTLVRTVNGSLVRVGRAQDGLEVGDWSDGPVWHLGIPSLWTSPAPGASVGAG